MNKDSGQKGLSKDKTDNYVEKIKEETDRLVRASQELIAGSRKLMKSSREFMLEFYRPAYSKEG